LPITQSVSLDIEEKGLFSAVNIIELGVQKIGIERENTDTPTGSRRGAIQR
jgi:hypothetical protein